MQGAKEYAEVLQRVASHNRAGFQYVSFNDKILNGHFYFVLGYDYNRKRTLNVYLLKNVKPKLLEFFPSFYLKEKNSLQVYGLIKDQYSINGRYDFLIDGIIKDELQKLFDTAIDEWYAVEREVKEAAENLKSLEEKCNKIRIEEFEKIFTEKYKENDAEESEEDDIDDDIDDDVDNDNEVEFEDIGDDDDATDEFVEEMILETNNDSNEDEKLSEDLFCDNENELTRNGV